MQRGQARWYFDADTIGPAKILCAARPDITYPGDSGARERKRHSIAPCVIQDTATPDEVWIPEVTKLGMIIVTRDKAIQSRTAEINAVVASQARMFAITSGEDLNRWGLLEVLLTQWRHMEAQAEERGPFICKLTRTSLTTLDL